MVAGHRDQIADFSDAEADRIHLSAIDANQVSADNQPSFVGSSAFSGNSGRAAL
jgi:hypothetical protein